MAKTLRIFKKDVGSTLASWTAPKREGGANPAYIRGMKLTKRIKDEAQRVFELGLAESKALPGMLGRVVPGMLAFNGFYTATVDGVKTLYVANGDPAFAELKRKAEAMIK